MRESRRRLGLGLLFVAHGIVHLWFVVLASGWVELSVDPGWNASSWLLTAVLGSDLILVLAGVLYALAAGGFVLGGTAYARGDHWAERLLVPTAILSAVTIVAMWDGTTAQLVEQGVLGVVIDVAILGLLALLE